MNKKDNFISEYQLFATIVVTIIGVGIFSYPSGVADSVGNDGWIVTIISGAIVYFLLYAIYKVQEINGFKDFIYIIKDNFGVYIGKVVGIVFVFINIAIVAGGMRIFSEVIKMYLLEKTPTEFIVVIMILIGTIVIRGGFKNLIKLNELLLPIIFLPMTIVIIILAAQGDYTNLLPVFQNTPFQYIKSITLTTFAFEGFEICYLAIPHVERKNKIPKVMFWSIFYVVVSYAITSIVSISVLGVEQTKLLIWPTITMIKSISIPGYFIEQWEGVVMIFWILLYVTTFVNLYLFSSVVVKSVFKLEDIKLSSVLITPFIYIFAMYPENLAQVYSIYEKISILAPIFTVAILIFLLGTISIIKRRGKR